MTQDIGLLSAIFFSLIGGLILNCMPCVFPVLSLKIIAIVKNNNLNRVFIRIEGLVYTLGVLCSMFILSAVLLTLRQSGQLIGWGYQMQSPVFITILIYVIFLIGLSFSGFYDIPFILPSFMDKYTHRKGFLGSFFTGVLTTFIATPCTAPFMASAISFAITQPGIYSIIIFQVLGLGISLPYLILSFFPKLLAFFPKPGPWMENLKEFLSFPMYLSAIWLLWVLFKQTNTNVLFATLFSLLLLVFSIWVYKLLPSKVLLVRCLFVAVLIKISLSTIYLSSELSKAVPEKNVVNFSQEKLDKLLNKNKSVLVSVGADWCLVCKMNELVLESDKVQNILKENDIVYMKADWTSKNQDITSYLGKFNRSDIPVYMLYINGQRIKMLPQLLSENVILESIRR